MPLSNIHPTAVVSPQAQIADDVSIGPFCVIESGSTIGAGCRLSARVMVKQGVQIGQDNEIFEGAVIGGPPQHLRAGNQIGGARIGDGNTIRENVTVHRALNEGDDTLIGDNNLLMVNAHVAHDCTIGNHAIITNNVMLAGHVVVEDRAYLSGGVGVHQYLRIGRLAMIGGLGHVKADVPPYVTVDGDTNKIVGLNLVGLRRAGLSCQEIDEIKSAYRVVYRRGLRWQEVLDALRDEFPEGPAAHFHTFLSAGQRGFIQERRTPRAATLRIAPVSRDADKKPSVGSKVG